MAGPWKSTCPPQIPSLRKHLLHKRPAAVVGSLQHTQAKLEPLTSVLAKRVGICFPLCHQEGIDVSRGRLRGVVLLGAVARIKRDLLVIHESSPRREIFEPGLQFWLPDRSQL